MKIALELDVEKFKDKYFNSATGILQQWKKYDRKQGKKHKESTTMILNII